MILVVLAIIFGAEYLIDARQAEAQYRTTVNRRLEAITLC